MIQAGIWAQGEPAILVCIAHCLKSGRGYWHNPIFHVFRICIVCGAISDSRHGAGDGNQGVVCQRLGNDMVFETLSLKQEPQWMAKTGRSDEFCMKFAWNMYIKCKKDVVNKHKRCRKICYKHVKCAGNTYDVCIIICMNMHKICIKYAS